MEPISSVRAGHGGGGVGCCLLFQVGVAVEAAAVGGEELLALLERDLAFLDRLLGPHLEAAHHLLGVVLDEGEDVGHGFAIDDLVYLVALLADGDVYGVDVAEEVVHVPRIS